jgi:hypothetical protein
MPPSNGQVPTWNSSLNPPFAWDDPPAGTPASTVVYETSWGLSPTVGTSTDYARANHSHGTPARPVPDAADYGKGTILVSNGTSWVTLAPGPNESLLMCDDTTATGLRWYTGS